ncbi:glycosyltransferase family 4 protein [Paenibacillus sp. UMB4589-SE434]|uniref:glycosyltransferase family 4 protein n=1 Tax=Paenibacillus sp. UMB4589-SE434 TaxID=3046314 RepID=UPI00254EBAB1|nr:glycosyltransferase family 4 protein [Paenibacillus sp. UMB4589-SE434]MDK8182007.1 glycosyltransferase family 4 protein [Paenibacillus sp. UMB4589-SE434]
MPASKRAQEAEYTQKRRILLAVTVQESVSFFEQQIQYLRDRQYEVTVVCSSRPADEALEGAAFRELRMNREMSPLEDIKSLWKAIKLIRDIKPDIVNAGTPKAGLIVGLAARICGVPTRVYTCHGLRLETLSGWKRRLLTWTERIAAANAHEVIAVSDSLRRKLASLRICAARKVTVPHNGSCKGIMAERYEVTPDLAAKAEELRLRLGVPREATLFGFVGRMTRDKGVDTLVEAFQLAKAQLPNVRLLLVGAREQADPITELTKQTIEADSHIIEAGYQHELPLYYAALDCLVLPSYREGLGNVVLEASAAGKPVIVARSTGLMDTVIDGQTGLMIEAGDASGLCAQMKYIALHREEGKKLGDNGKRRVVRDFHPYDVIQAFGQVYERLYLRSGASNTSTTVSGEAYNKPKQREETL